MVLNSTKVMYLLIHVLCDFAKNRASKMSDRVFLTHPQTNSKGAVYIDFFKEKQHLSSFIVSCYYRKKYTNEETSYFSSVNLPDVTDRELSFYSTFPSGGMD